PVRAVLPDGVHVRRGDHLDDLGPARADQAALASGGLVEPGSLGVAGDVGPRGNRITETRAGLAVELEQDATDVRVADAGRRVGVPAERGASRAAARLVLGPVRSNRRIVRLLCLPRDDAVLDVHLPGTGASAVHAV